MPDTKKYISQLNVGGVTYDIKDLEARALAQGGIHYIGITTTDLTDGATTSPIVINKVNVTPKKGDLALYAEAGGEHTEYLWNGEHWDRLGYGKFGDLAYKNGVSASVDISHDHNFTLEDATADLSGGATTGVAVAPHDYTPAGTIGKGTGTANYTPEGTVTLGGETAKTVAISGKTADATVGAHTYTPAGNIEVTTASPNVGETANYTPSGNVSTPTFTGKQATLSHAAHTHNLTGNIEVENEVNLSATGGGVDPHKVTVTGADYTPAGSVSQPTFTGTDVSYTPAGTVGIPAIATNNAVKASVSGEVLTFGEADIAVSAPAFTGTAKTIKIAGTVSKPTFTGTAATITPGVAVADHKFTQPTITGAVTATATNDLAIGETTIGAHTYTPEGNVSQPTFTGSGIVIKATFKGTQATLSHTAHSHAAGTLAGSVDVPTTATFAGKGVQLVFNGTKATLAHTVTQGTVSGSITYKKLKDITAYSGTKTVAVTVQ